MKEILENLIKDYCKENSIVPIIDSKDVINAMKMKEYNFSTSISKKEIYQYKKHRTVISFHSFCVEEIILKYLKKIIDFKFNIAYSNRNDIMLQVIENTEVISNMSGFTIYKFDFKNFFDSFNLKNLLDKYFANSNLLRYEIDTLEDFSNTFVTSFAGIGVINAFVEIISRDFDIGIRTSFMDTGLIHYSRYVDDCLLIFNENISLQLITDRINKVINEVFAGHKVTINFDLDKTLYLNKDSICDMDKFTYLGYLFVYRKQPRREFFSYGISSDKRRSFIKKYMKIVEEYNINEDLFLFQERYNFLTSRVVFYNNFSSYLNKDACWEVIGIIDTYAHLRKFIQERDKIEQETLDFLTRSLKIIALNQCPKRPYFLVTSNRVDDGYSLKHRLRKNKTILLNPHIGWNYMLLKDKVERMYNCTIYKKVPYRFLVKMYCNKMVVK